MEEVCFPMEEVESIANLKNERGHYARVEALCTSETIGQRSIAKWEDYKRIILNPFNCDNFDNVWVSRNSRQLGWRKQGFHQLIDPLPSKRGGLSKPIQVFFP